MVRNCLKPIAIVLILLPEPITTALGIALLSVAFALPGYKRLGSFGDLEELAKRSLKSAEPGELSHCFPGEKIVIFHELNISLPSQGAMIPGEKVPGHAIQNSDIAVCRNDAPERAHSDFQTHNWFDNRRVPERILHHTLKTSLPQYEASPGVLQTSGFRSTSTETEQTVELHTLKASWVAQKPDQENDLAGGSWLDRSIMSDKVVHHTLKTSPLHKVSLPCAH
jgi:hypothetical protein